MSKNPANRYQSAGDMRSDLVRVLGGQRPSAPMVMNDEDRTTILGAVGSDTGNYRTAPDRSLQHLRSCYSSRSAPECFHAVEAKKRSILAGPAVPSWVLTALLTVVIGIAVMVLGGSAPVNPVLVLVAVIDRTGDVLPHSGELAEGRDGDRSG